MRLTKKKVFKEKRRKMKDDTREELDMMCGHPDCVYAMKLFGGMCDYLEIEGHSRGCPPDYNCNKYKSGKMDKRKVLKF